MLSTGSGRGFEADGMKRQLEEGEAEGQGEAEGAKRACREDGNADVEAFFALVEKIAATERFLGRRRWPNRAEMADKKMTVTSKTAWQPAFEWQDFCPSANGNRDVVAGKAEEESSDSKERIAKSNHDTTKSIDEDDNNCYGDGSRSLDLNLPSTSPSPGLELSL